MGAQTVVRSARNASLPAALVAGLLALALVACGSSEGTTGPPLGGADRDRDGVADSVDNCPDHVNAQQFDSDADGVGNPCDNCPFAFNPAQTDIDLDGVGDACGANDADGDGVVDFLDNCPFTPNPDQRNTDLGRPGGDGLGDACDEDIDGDGIPDQEDPDRDGDFVLNGDDDDPDDATRCRDTDGDGCDDCASGTDDPANDGPDSDGDGFCDAGLSSTRLVVGVTGPSLVFGVQVSVEFDAAAYSTSPNGVDGLEPYDPDNYTDAVDIRVSANTSVAGRVTVTALFGETEPDRSFLPPSDVIGVEFDHRLADPVLGDFDLVFCQVVDIEGVPVAGSDCVLDRLEALP